MWLMLINLWVFYVTLMVLMWVVNTLLPLPKVYKGLGIVLILIFGGLYTLQYFGWLDMGIPVFHYF